MGLVEAALLAVDPAEAEGEVEGLGVGDARLRRALLLAIFSQTPGEESAFVSSHSSNSGGPAKQPNLQSSTVHLPGVVRSDCGRHEPDNLEDQMAAIPDEAKHLFESKDFAHVATLNADGSPQVSAVWIGLDGDLITFNTAEGLG